jgi:hypothetical protein
MKDREKWRCLNYALISRTIDISAYTCKLKKLSNQHSPGEIQTDYDLKIIIPFLGRCWIGCIMCLPP